MNNLKEKFIELKEFFLFYLKEIYISFKKIKNGIINIIRWFPIIWLDRNYDSYYIFEILKHKLKLQSNHIKKHNNHTLAIYDSNRMNLCVSLIEKIQEEYYLTEYLDYYECEFKFEKCENNCSKITDTTIKKDDLDIFFKKYKRKYKKYQKDIKDNNRELIANSISLHNHNKSKMLLFSILEKDIERWWD